MSVFSEPIKYIYFKNDTNFPLQIGSWVDRSNTMKFIRIGPGEKWMVHSSVGEWHMDSMFDDIVDRDAWVKAGLSNHHIIGKFWSRPCISGEYASMEYWKPFDCVYSETDDAVKGLITFIQHPTS